LVGVRIWGSPGASGLWPWVRLVGVSSTARPCCYVVYSNNDYILVNRQMFGYEKRRVRFLVGFSRPVFPTLLTYVVLSLFLSFFRGAALSFFPREFSGKPVPYIQMAVTFEREPLAIDAE